MLSAILHGKGRRLPADLPPGASLRSALIHSEDLLTATVFERLAYMGGPTLWQVLAETFRPRVLPPRKVADLVDVTFWPMWGQARGKLGKAVEPDVVLTFDIGDPPVRVVLIVECKLDGFQYPGQWAEEWFAHSTTEDADDAGEVYLLALGGLAKAPEKVVAEFADTLGRDHGLRVSAAAAGWQDLRGTLDEIDLAPGADRRAADDILAALDLYGFRRFRALADLSEYAGGQGKAMSPPLALLMRYGVPPTAEGLDRVFADLAEATAALRPVREHDALRWSSADE